MTATFDMPPDGASLGASLPTGIELVEEVAAAPHDANGESWTGFEPMHARAVVGTQDAGAIGWVLPQAAERLGAPCVNIWRLSVKEPFRQRGFASALMACALRRGRAQGARHASVGTQLWNAPAHATCARVRLRAAHTHVGPPLDHQ